MATIPKTRRDFREAVLSRDTNAFPWDIDFEIDLVNHFTQRFCHFSYRRLSALEVCIRQACGPIGTEAHLSETTVDYYSLAPEGYNYPWIPLFHALEAKLNDGYTYSYTSCLQSGFRYFYYCADSEELQATSSLQDELKDLIF